MTEPASETILGPVDSAITHLLQGFEVAMWASGIAPGTVTEVLNRVTFGDPRGGGPNGRVEGIPDWAESLGTRLAALTERSVADLPPTVEIGGEPVRDHLREGIRLVVLSLVRQVLQDSSGPVEQALGS